MQRFKGSFLVVAFMLNGLRAAATPLDDYVQAPDPAFRWTEKGGFEAGSCRAVVLDLRSQTWRASEEVEPTEWRHWLTLIIPQEVRGDTAFLLIGGGARSNPAPTSADPMLIEFAQTSKTVVAELSGVPNQPLHFKGDPLSAERGGLKEDALIAYSWQRYKQTGDPAWAARLPMTKSVVRAMDALQAYARESLPQPIEHFVVAGASKRGWTTWTTAAVDPRVRAVCPIVIDVLNVEASMRHHHAAYGFWAPAIGSYSEREAQEWLDSPQFDALMALVDPYSYRERYTMPKYIVNSTGDEFFLPDSSRFYYDDLPGESRLRYVPNTSHSLEDSDAAEGILAWYLSLLAGIDRPQVEWTIDAAAGGTLIRAVPASNLAQAVLWEVHNPEARDFRLEAIGPTWKSTQLEAKPDGSYEALIRVPEQGWRAGLVELRFDTALPLPLVFTTEVAVAPESLPYAEKAIEE